MTATLHLFRIEFKRNAALWLFPVMLGLLWFVAQGEDSQSDGVMLWSEVSARIAASLLIVGPLIGGVAAWMAARERRRRTEELLATTPRPAFARDLSGWAAVASWGLLAYVLVGLYRGVENGRDATWGGPEWASILVGLVTVAACAALGYAAGVFVPSRFTAALLPIVLFVAGNYGSDGDVSLRHLSPVTLVYQDGHSVYYELRAELEPLQMAWLAGLGVVALAAVALRRKDSAPARGALITAVVLTVLVATLLLRIDPSQRFTEAAPVEQTCTQRSILVCLHPAYKAVLDEEAELVDRLIRPLAGLPGAPTRAEQVTFGTSPVQQDALVLLTAMNGHKGDPAEWGISVAFLDAEAESVAWQLVRSSHGEDRFGSVTEAQAALAVWLVRQAGDLPAGATIGPEGVAAIEARIVDPQWTGGDAASEQRVIAAAERFAALDPAQQRAWLEANYTALRAGELTLDDLP